MKLWILNQIRGILLFRFRVQIIIMNVSLETDRSGFVCCSDIKYITEDTNESCLPNHMIKTHQCDVFLSPLNGNMWHWPNGVI